ncbi:MAG: V-type ATP synthase subunit D [Nitrospinae bacterium]|nr:V-type ATP synthase subunit D [Nitrospinota bacterium]
MEARVRTGRLELLRLRDRRKLVARGISILTSKRDALLMEFKGVVRQVRDLRKMLDDKILTAERALNVARAMEPAHSLLTESLAAERDISFNVALRNVWGVKIATVDFPEERRTPFERGSAPGHRSPAVDEAAGLFEDVLPALAQSAAAESRLLSIGGAIRNATRRVNALERKVEPEIKSTMERIMAQLEERAREETFRLKRFKSIKERG